MRRCILVALLAGGCAHEEAKPAVAPTSTSTPKTPNLSPEVVQTLERLPTDAERLSEIAKLDKANEEKKAKVEELERLVSELQAKLDSALAGDKSAGSPPKGDAPVARAGDPPARNEPPAPERSSDATVTRDVSGNKVKVQLQGELVFSLGSARITRAGRQTLDQIAGVLKSTPSKRIEVVGHTDSLPTAKKYEDNWQLSAERARRVVAYLHEHGVTGQRMVASGYADTDPVDTADSEEARRKNRRVEIYIEPTE